MKGRTSVGTALKPFVKRIQGMRMFDITQENDRMLVTYVQRLTSLRAI